MNEIPITGVATVHFYSYIFFFWCVCVNNNHVKAFPRKRYDECGKITYFSFERQEILNIFTALSEHIF